ncbi:MAG: tRNA pseudouridine(38-40) synthase TruA [Ruminococcaceae bacterium]|mgnify:CR=1 FL=1|nr:tRNA pseudouridine(38-40) synthase TruA [Oscillospiraceae bacterium]
MRNILLVINYIGTNYHGWQIQENANTVQAELQKALKTVLGDFESLIGCSRTDAGAHAHMYCCTVRTENRMNIFKLQRALNSTLPLDIAVKHISVVDKDFHPRYNCTSKTYAYHICNAPVRNPFCEERALHYRPKIDEEKLNKIAQDFVGTHDFSAFCGRKTSVEDKTRTIYDVKIERKGDIVVIFITGDGFLYNMVRIMVGTLLFINEGKIAEDAIPKIFKSKDRKSAGKTVPAYGLYLYNVDYNGCCNGDENGSTQKKETKI